MTESCATGPKVRARPSLSVRLWLLATLAVLLSEIVFFLPYLAHQRRELLMRHVADASIAVLAASGDPLDAAKRAELLALAGAEAIRLRNPDGTSVTVARDTGSSVAAFDLREENLVSGIGHALGATVRQGDRLMSVVARSPSNPNIVVELVVHERPLGETLRRITLYFAGLSVLIAGIAGGLVYLAVLVLLVRPMHRITSSIMAFRADPERTTPLDPEGVTLLPNDEIAIAGQELAAMQHELRAALWRNARLAAIGTVVAKVSHDLRGILTPALLTAERLQLNPDPKVRRAGEALVQVVDRATDLVRRTLDYAREGPPPLAIAPVGLARLMAEAAETARPAGSIVHLENAIDQAVMVAADRNQLFRVLVNLLRNSAEAGARRVHVSAQGTGPVVLDIADDGPGLPEAVRTDLFRPFAGSIRHGGTGLGMAIARDLMVAHGGDIELVETGPAGTTFRLTLPAAEPATQVAA
jgi:signal transduction histidine kinase